MKTLHIIYLTMLILFSNHLLTKGQPAHNMVKSPEQREKIEALKIGFLTEKLHLTSEEAQLFWPVYNKYKNELKALREDKHEWKTSAQKPIENMNEQELNEFLEFQFAHQQKMLDLKKKYFAEFKKVLPLKKVALLYQAEEEFKMHLLHQTQKSDRPYHGNQPQKF
jgi:hypothetical protein